MNCFRHRIEDDQSLLILGTQFVIKLRSWSVFAFFMIYVTETVQISPIRVLVHFSILNRPELRVFNELVLVYESLHGLPGDVVIILPIFLTRARLSEYFQYRDY